MSDTHDYRAYMGTYPPAELVTGTVELPDIHPRDTQRLIVKRTDTEVAFAIVGKRGSVKAALWISPEHAQELAALLAEK